jgi:molybdopterin-guanine dinucleotide biosynthesis protein
MGFRSKMKVVGFVLLNARMKDCGMSLERILRSFILHHEMVIIEGFNNKKLKVVIDVTKNVDGKFVGLVLEKGVCCHYHGAKKPHVILSYNHSYFL